MTVMKYHQTTQSFQSKEKAVWDHPSIVGSSRSQSQPVHRNVFTDVCLNVGEEKSILKHILSAQVCPRNELELQRAN